MSSGARRDPAPAGTDAPVAGAAGTGPGRTGPNCTGTDRTGTDRAGIGTSAGTAAWPVLVATVLAGGLLLVWPAFLNGYPLLFSDSGAFLHQTTGPLMIWDKPWIYGPMLFLGHWHLTLWGAAIGQGVVLSHLLFLAGRAAWGNTGPGRHLAVSAFAALATTAPWSAALLMPDILAAVTVLCLWLLGFARDRLGRGEAWWVAGVATLAIASHLSHLPIAAALVLLAAILARRPRPVLRMAVPLLGALILLLASNLVGHGRLSPSPHGSTFALARLIANGPAARTIAAECPARGWYLCAWAGRLPTDSDAFLWEPDSPVNRDAEGRPRFLGGALLSDEAREIVAATLRREPVTVLLDGLRDAARQLVTARVGDTLGRDHLGGSVRPRIAEAFPARELAAYDASAQVADRLPARAAPFLWPHPPVLLGGALLLFWRALRDRHRPRRLALALCVLAGIGANAFATGALSKPHDRYGARIAWLAPLAAMVLCLPPRRRGELAA